MATTNPPKWHQVYPQGTVAGSEEHKFFVALARHPKFAWRSVAAIEKESGLTRKRVEELLQKYFNKGMVFQSPKNEDNWGYWERVPEMLPKNDGGLASKDQKKRIDKASGKSTSNSSNSNSGSAKKASSGSGGGYGGAAIADDDDDDMQAKVYPMQNGGSPGFQGTFLHCTH